MAVKLTRIMFPFLLLVALAAQAMGILNSCNQFGVPALSIYILQYRLSWFWAGAWVCGRSGLGLSPIEGMAYGVVVGGAWQLFWQVPSLIRRGFVFRPRFDLSHPGLRNIAHLMGPAIVGNASVQVNVMVNTNFASSITDAAGHIMNGPVSWLGYAFRFMMLPLGLFGVAIGSATLPSISRSAATGDMAEFRNTLGRSLGLIFLLTIPSSVALAVLGDSMIALVYQGGKFRVSDTHQTALALSCYAVGLAGYAAIKVLAPAFYALNDARTPMIVSLISIVINAAVASSMVKLAGLGQAGLALSTSIVALVSSVVLFEVLRRRVGGVHGRRLFTSFVKITAASVAMGVACALSSRLIGHLAGLSRIARAVDLAISIPLGLAVFYAGCKVVQLPELEAARRALVDPITRRLGRRPC